jgi:hypothetical protein
MLSEKEFDHWEPLIWNAVAARGRRGNSVTIRQILDDIEAPAELRDELTEMIGCLFEALAQHGMLSDTPIQ